MRALRAVTTTRTIQVAGLVGLVVVLVAWRRRAILTWLSGDPVQRV